MDRVDALAAPPPVNGDINIARYFHSARLLHIQAKSYLADGNNVFAYVMFLKFARLSLEELPKHPDYKRPEYKAQRKQTNTLCSQALGAVEKLKPVVADLYKPKPRPDPEPAPAPEPSPSPEPVPDAAPEPVPEPEDPAPAVPTTKKPYSVPIIPPAVVDPAPSAPPMGGAAAPVYPDGTNAPLVPVAPPLAALAPSLGPYAPPTLSPAESLLDAPIPGLSSSATPLIPAPSDGASTAPPTLTPAAPALPASVTAPVPAPAPPASVTAPVPAPAPPASVTAPVPVPAPIPTHVPTPALPAPPPGPQPQPLPPLGHRPQDGLRRLVVYDTMLADFLKVAHSNTARNIETCGVLAGVLRQDVLYITHLIIPKQRGNSDNCETIAEDEIWIYQSENDLLTLGWIHTHPSQQCFLSSIDLHTQCGYQSMLPEACAIVLSPQYSPNCGIFRLTTPDGLKRIQACPRKGFHPHDPPTTFRNCDHVSVVPGVGYVVVDMR